MKSIFFQGLPIANALKYKSTNHSLPFSYFKLETPYSHQDIQFSKSIMTYLGDFIKYGFVLNKIHK